jgi:predicted enzyme related to lactoylglutathione lyase
MTKRMVVVVIEVADVERSAVLYREAFGIDLHLDDHEGGAAGAGDRWTSGRHAAFSWTDGAYLHFAIYPAKEDGPTRGVQLGFIVDDLAIAHSAAVAAGAHVIHGPRVEGNWGPTARYLDFDGNVVSLTQPR